MSSRWAAGPSFVDNAVALGSRSILVDNAVALASRSVLVGYAVGASAATVFARRLPSSEIT
jgi:hypothetical protein